MKIIDDNGKEIALISKRTVDILLWFRDRLPDNSIELEASIVEGLFSWISTVANHITSDSDSIVTIDDKFFDHVPKATILGLRVLDAYSETFSAEEALDETEKN